MTNLSSLLTGWSSKGRQLLSANTQAQQYEPVDIESTVERVREVTDQQAPNRKGWAIPLHEPDAPTVSGQYVVWRPESSTIGWFDSRFGINGTERFAKAEDLADTVIGHRLRFWAQGEQLSPEDVDFELPPGSIKPQSHVSSEAQNQFFADLTSFVKEEKNTARQSNWKSYTELGLEEAISREKATGPFIPLGKGEGQFGAEGFKYQLASDEDDEHEIDEDIDLRDEYGLFRGTQVIVDAETESDVFPIPAKLAGLYDLTIVISPDWSKIENRGVVEKHLAESGPDIWVSDLLNPVPYDRQLNAIQQVKNTRAKRDLITGDRALRFSTNTFALPEPEIDLNEYQHQAFVWADSAKDIVCIHGPPGTGKTRTLTAYVQHAVSAGQRVLVTAHSNQAVDNLLVGDSTLDEPEADTLHDIAQTGDSDLTIARVGSNTRSSVVQEHYMGVSPSRANVVAATNSGASKFNQDEFDVAVVDEATQASRPSTAIVLNCAEKLVLAGDHKQLPPYSADETMQDEELHISLFEYLLDRYDRACSVLLRAQYRMNHQIAAFPNKAFYDGELETAERNHDWSISDLKPLMGVDIQGTEQELSYGKSKYNLKEAEAAAKQVKLLGQNGVSPDDIGVITAYTGQKAKITAALHDIGIDRPNAVTVDTVDSFQGGEREAIIISFVRSNDDGYSGFLEFPDVGPRRLNVALTRAKKRLVLIGNWDTLSTVAPHRTPDESCAELYAALAEHIRDQNLMLTPGSRAN